MSKKQKFIEFVKAVMDAAKVEAIEDDDVRLYWEAFCSQSEEKEKPAFTDNGKLVLGFLQQHQEPAMWKARDIAEELFVSSRMVSGAMRKLVTDGYIEKVGESPVIYMLTEKGKNITID